MTGSPAIFVIVMSSSKSSSQLSVCSSGCCRSTRFLRWLISEVAGPVRPRGAASVGESGPSRATCAIATEVSIFSALLLLRGVNSSLRGCGRLATRVLRVGVLCDGSVSLMLPDVRRVTGCAGGFSVPESVPRGAGGRGGSIRAEQ